MMPTPTHLRNLVSRADSIADESALEAALRCPCGSEGFRLMFPGETHQHAKEPIPCVASIEGEHFFLVRADCASCGEGHVLLDQDFHGWNGWVCRDSAQAALPRPSLSVWSCLSCTSESHSARVTIQTEGKEDFVDEAGDAFDSERWFDGFGYFQLGIACLQCEKATPEWVGLETM